MDTQRQRLGRATLCFGFALLVLGGGAASHTHALDKARTISVDEIKPGMKGYGLTVFRGEQPERFDVEVIDVLHQFQPDLDLILIRTTHPILEQAKSVAGMSGSPIYLDGRLAGAYAYGWTYGTEPIAGVTPIANMLREMERPRLPETTYPMPSQRGARRSARDGERRAPRAELHDLDGPAPEVEGHHGEFAAAAHAQLQPAATPLLLGGVPTPLTPWLEREFAKFGFVPLQAGGAQRRAQTPKSARKGAVPELPPGGALSVDLTRGDISMRAIGTITHSEGSRVLAFGHPMFNLGQVRLPMSSARVLHIMSSLRSSFKFAESLSPAGAIVQDRASTIVGSRDETAPMIPMQIHLRGVPGIVKPDWSLEVAWHPQITPLLVYTALGSALSAAFADQLEFRIQTQTAAKISGMDEVTFRDVAQTQSGPLDPAYFASMRLFPLHDIVTRNPFTPARVESLRVDIDVTPGNFALEIENVTVPWGEVDPGSSIPVTVRLRPYGGAVQTHTVDVMVPMWAAGKDIEVRVLPGNQVPVPRPDPTSLELAVRNLLSGFQANDLVVSIRTPGRGVLLPGQALDNIPASVADALQGTNTSESAEPFVSAEYRVISMPNVVYGRGTVQLKVRRSPKRANHGQTKTK